MICLLCTCICFRKCLPFPPLNTGDMWYSPTSLWAPRLDIIQFPFSNPAPAPASSASNAVATLYYTVLYTWCTGPDKLFIILFLVIMLCLLLVANLVKDSQLAWPFKEK